jgi:hypothetical protein
MMQKVENLKILDAHMGMPHIIVTDNTETKLFYNFRYLAALLLSGGFGFRKI